MFGKPKPLCEFCNTRKTREIDELTSKPCCPACKQRLRIEREDKYICPVDKVAMEKEVLFDGRLIIDRCPTCKGVWLTQEELGTIREVAEEEGSDQFWTGFIVGGAVM